MLEMKVSAGDGSSEWVGVELRFSCYKNHCEGQVWEYRSMTYVLIDHAVFRGRKGTYHETGWKET